MVVAVLGRFLIFEKKVATLPMVYWCVHAVREWGRIKTVFIFANLSKFLYRFWLQLKSLLFR